MDAVQFEQSWPSQMATDLRLRQYNPSSSSPYASRIPDREWDRIRPTIENLHRMGTTRIEILRLLKDNHKFTPSYNQLAARMNSWGCKSDRKSNVDRYRTKNNEAPMPATEPAPAPKVIPSETVLLSMDWEVVPTTSDQINEEPKTQEATGFMTSIMERVFNPFIIIGYSDLSDKFCILHDIADVLAHSAWAPTHSCKLAHALLQFADNKHFVVRDSAYVLLWRDILRWSVKWKDRSEAVLVLQQIQDYLNTVDPAYDAPAAGSERHYRLLLSALYPLTDLEGSMTMEEVKVPDTVAIDSCYYEEPTEGNMLRSKAHSLYVDTSMKPNVYPLAKQACEVLLKWCQQQIAHFDLCFDFVEDDILSSNTKLIYYCCAQLTTFVLQEWIEHTEMTALFQHDMTRQSSDIRSVSDFVTFKVVSRILVSIVTVITQRAESGLLSLDCTTDDRDQLGTAATHIFKTVGTTLQLNSFELITLLYRPLPSLKSEYTAVGLDDNILDFVVMIAKECHQLRNDDFSWRHRVALEELYNSNQVKQTRSGQESPHGLQTTLCAYQSTASLKSFRRVGRGIDTIKQEQQQHDAMEGVVPSYGAAKLSRRSSSGQSKSGWSFMNLAGLAKNATMSNCNLGNLTKVHSVTWTEISI